VLITTYFHLILTRCTLTWVEEASFLVVARSLKTSRSTRLLQALRFTSQQSSRQHLSVCTAKFVLFEGDTNNLAARHCSAGSRRTQSSTAVRSLFKPATPLLTTSLTRSIPSILLNPFTITIQSKLWPIPLNIPSNSLFINYPTIRHCIV
jgi:hypothetical protein